MSAQNEFDFNNTHVKLESLSDRLSVSVATIKNWCRQNNLPISKGLILEEDVEKLIRFSEQDKLTSRANKRYSEQRKIHNELGSKEAKAYFEKYFSDLSPQQASDKLMLICDEFDLIESYKQSGIWEDSASFSHQEEMDSFLTCLNEDFLGFLYLSTRTDSEKNLNGKFYTPFFLCKQTLKEFSHSRVSTFIDPCCGSGAFLVAAYHIFGKDLQLIGNDSDAISLNLCKFNLRWFAKDCKWNLTAKSYEDMTLPVDGEDILIGTNPPWGSQATRNTKNSDLSVQVTEFFLKRFKAANTCFVLPTSLFEVLKHKNFRLKLSEEKKIISVKHIGKPFKGLLTEVSVLYAIGEDTKLDKPVVVFDALGNTFTINKDRLTKIGGELGFFIGNSDKYVSLWNKLKSFPLINLSDFAEFALGIVTGDNKGLLLESSTPTSEPCCTGKNIKSMEKLSPSVFIEFYPERFQQCAPERLLRASNQVIYRFIANKIICTPSNGNVLCLNSANIIVLEKGKPNWLVASLLQSQISQAYNRLVFKSNKVLKSHLIRLPLPNLDNNSLSIIRSEYERFKNSEITKIDYLNSVDRVVNNFFELTEDEILLLTAS